MVAGRPDDISEAELWSFLEGLPRRYLALFGLATVYRHVRLARDIHPDEVHASLEKHEDIWELTVVTLDKPFLFSNISGVLSYFGMDIHRGQAMTTPDGLVLDVFEFTDDERFLEQNAGGRRRDPRDAADGRRRRRRRDDAAARQGAERALSPPAAVRAGRSTSTTSTRRSTPSSRSSPTTRSACCTGSAAVISRHGCDVDLVLISTEGKKAIDVLHVTKRENKLSEAEQAALGQDLERMLEGWNEAD